MNGTTACAWDVVIPFEPMWEAVKHVLKPDGAFVTTASQPFTSLLVASNIEWLKYECVWDKVNHANFLRAKFEPLEVHEDILVFGAAGKLKYNPQYRQTVSKLFGKRSLSASEHHTEMIDNGVHGVGYPKSILRFPKPNNLSGGGLHPTQKPVALYKYFVQTYTNPGDTVLDMCIGSGTTGEACLELGRNFIGCETEEEYFLTAQKRLDRVSRQGQLFSAASSAKRVEQMSLLP